MKIIVKSKLREDDSLEELEDFLAEKSHCTIANSVSLSYLNDKYTQIQLTIRSRKTCRKRKHLPSNKSKVLNSTIMTLTKYMTLTTYKK